MPMKTDPSARIDAALLELAEDFRGSLFSPELSDKITMRVLGKNAGRKPAGTSCGKPEPLRPEEIRAIRQHANMSQAVFAQVLNVTTGYISQIERGTKRPTGPALALLRIIHRKGIRAVL
jgi:putative transcriptional regulator